MRFNLFTRQPPGAKRHFQRLSQTIATALEINNSPFRLDLNDTWARKAREAGTLLAIDNDAHYPAEYDYVRYGLAIARRAGLTPDRVLNTRDPEGLLAFCREKAARPVANLR